jgi:hypothetical protein
MPARRALEHQRIWTKLVARFVDMKSGRHTADCYDTAAARPSSGRLALILYKFSSPRAPNHCALIARTKSSPLPSNHRGFEDVHRRIDDGNPAVNARLTLSFEECARRQYDIVARTPDGLPANQGRLREPGGWIVRITLRCTPFRKSRNSTLCPTRSSASALRSCAALSRGTPFMDTATSPALMPA